MPSPSTTELPLPKSWDEFEDITADILKLRWGTPHVTRHGRPGQPQKGVDVYGRPKHLDGKYAGAQCKRLSDPISWHTVKNEVEKADEFLPPLGEFIIATTTPRDANLQEKVRFLNVERHSLGKFPVELLFWEDICLDLAGDKHLLAKHFPNWNKLSVDERQPSIDVHWLLGEEPTKILRIETTPEKLTNFAMQFKPFRRNDIEYLKSKHPQDGALAQKYNEEVEVALRDKSLERKWLAHHAFDRYKFGKKCGVAVEVDGVEARDILIYLDFSDQFEVYEIGCPPEKIDCPELPVRPRLSAERISRLNSFNFPDYGLIGIDFSQSFDIGRLSALRLTSHIKGRSISVKDNEVKLCISRLAQRRMLSFNDDDDGIVVAPKVVDGRYKIRWTADAVNLEERIHGELEIEVVPRSSTNEEPEGDVAAFDIESKEL
ncbi:restriction endonuclease [Archangium sp. Cb G35]|uniref:restriction endonuclease n=1 Tax=Archangium sp. Cb G35 TaxID=1920190 RepID=UPI000AA2B2FD|nr:restriction endonuclease [Archangium sp. Cb G35]